MSKFTPGPWGISFDCNGVAYIGAPPANTVTVAVLPIDGTQHANAYLIALAPEMHAFIEEWLADFTAPGSTDSPREAQARSILARINGDA